MYKYNRTDLKTKCFAAVGKSWEAGGVGLGQPGELKNQIDRLTLL